MVTIAIDALGIGPPGGGRSATLNVLRELFRLDASRRYLLYLDRPEPELAHFNHVQQLCVPLHGRMLSRVWAQAVWPAEFRARGVALVHHMKNLMAVGLPGPTVCTIFDLTMFQHPEIFSRIEVLYWRHVQPLMLRRARQVVAISEQTAADLRQRYGLPPQQVRTIYLASNPLYRPLPPSETEAIGERYALGPRFLLHVGSLSIKKNLLTLLRAYELLCDEGYSGALCLVGRAYETGRDRPFYDHLARSPYRRRVVLTGAVPEKDLVALYSAAEAMVFPSLHEGFGIVPLEAMACGCPVVCSAGGALPEVIGDGGLIVRDSLNAAALAEAIRSLTSDAAVRDDWSRAALSRSRVFSAEASARRTLALYDELLAGAP